MNWRIIHDRRFQLVATCDKLAMKDLARSIVPEERDLRIPVTYWSGSDIRTAPNLDEFGHYVVKPNNGSGEVLLGPVSRDQLITRTEGWLRSKAAHQLGEWGYRHARELLIVEERIPSPQIVPVDFKFFVFSGTVGFIQANAGRFGGDPSWTFYTPQWDWLPVGRRGYARIAVPRPRMLERMVSLAQRLAAGWDHIRIDLYSTEHSVWFGEFSPYHHGGIFPFHPRVYDHQFGQLWTLPAIKDVQQKGRWITLDGLE